MMGGPITHLAAAATAGLVVLGAAKIAEPPPVNRLVLESFSYVEIEGLGYIQQRLSGADGGAVVADWATQINRPHPNGVTELICHGESEKPGTYFGETDTWGLDDWTGGSCPKTLITGDRVEAVWTYEGRDGSILNLGVSYTVGAQE